MKMQSHVPESYIAYRRRAAWIENSLARSDEDINAKFDWSSIRLFGPYIARYRFQVLLSVVLMLIFTALNLANPYLIGVAIDSFITNHDIRGLAIIGIVLLLVNIAMWQAQYWQIWTMSWAGQQNSVPSQHRYVCPFTKPVPWLLRSYTDRTCDVTSAK